MVYAKFQMCTMVRKQAPHSDACMCFTGGAPDILLQCLSLLAHLTVGHLCENNTFIYIFVCVLGIQLKHSTNALTEQLIGSQSIYDP